MEGGVQMFSEPFQKQGGQAYTPATVSQSRSIPDYTWLEKCLGLPVVCDYAAPFSRRQASGTEHPEHPGEPFAADTGTSAGKRDLGRHQ